MRQRAEAELVLACAPLEDALAAAKAAHAEEGSDESRQAKRDAMATMHETRAWLRAADEMQRLPRTIASLETQLATADGERAFVLGARLQAARQRLARIEREHGPLVRAMEELAAAGGEG